MLFVTELNRVATMRYKPPQASDDHIASQSDRRPWTPKISLRTPSQSWEEDGSIQQRRGLFGMAHSRLESLPRSGLDKSDSGINLTCEQARKKRFKYLTCIPESMLIYMLPHRLTPYLPMLFSLRHYFLLSRSKLGKLTLGGKQLTDYPDETIISILHQNLATNQEQVKTGCSISAVGYAWGADVSPLLSLATHGYDVLILSDLLHFDSSHGDILSTVTQTLKRSPDARVYLAAGLYTHESVRQAFLKAGEEVGLDWTSIENDGIWRGETRVTSDGETWTQEDLSARKANVVAWIGKWRQG
ncbi:unnamed protein product [Rhizoctonia solani]|uniref:Uncharacterized protein n=1 Tax=Rhizoctonia solani TaxID=456999 RepID=A0A8H3E5Y4_9AGAM|nr:unnamed protein product [Rhizoctonia solani]